MMAKAKRALRLRLRDRSTGDLLVLLIALTITFVLVTVAVSTIIFVFLNPGGPPVDNAVRLITDMMNTLIGLLAGFMVGRTRTVVTSGETRHEASSDNASEYINTSHLAPQDGDPLEAQDENGH
jgi:hypothetical protein